MTPTDTESASDAPDPKSVDAPAKPKAKRWRRITGAVCLVLSCILAPLAVVTTWAKNEIINTDQYVSTVAPLASNQALTDYVADRVTEQLTSSVDLDETIRDALPPKAAFLAAPLSTGINTLISNVTHKALASPQFRQIWIAANRAAHSQVRQALTGDGKNVHLDNGRVVLDLDSVITDVKAHLSDSGVKIFNRIPASATDVKINLFDAKGLEKARRGLRLLILLRIALLLLTFVFLAIGIFLSSNRRRSLVHWGFGLATSLGVVAFGLTFGRGYVLDNVGAGGMPRPAMAGVIDAMTHYLRLGLRIGIVAGLLTAIIAMLAGPGRGATRIRGIAIAGFSHAPSPALGPVPGWVAAHRNVLMGLGIAVALLAIVGGFTPGPVELFIAFLVLLLWIGVIEILARAGSLANPE